MKMHLSIYLYILFETEKKQEDRFFDALLDLIPLSYGHFNTFFTQAELEYLKGSPLKE